MTTPTLPEGYTIHHAAPSVEDYLFFRSSADTLTKINTAQASAALSGSWHIVYITHVTKPGKAVAMGRVVGDGAWYFSIADIVVLPEHRRKGLAGFVVFTLRDVIKQRAPSEPPGPFVMLFAAPDARKLYAKHGFKDTMPNNMGMGQWLQKD